MTREEIEEKYGWQPGEREALEADMAARNGAHIGAKKPCNGAGAKRKEARSRTSRTEQTEATGANNVD